jgi:hypothetical protein
MPRAAHRAERLDVLPEPARGCGQELGLRIGLGRAIEPRADSDVAARLHHVPTVHEDDARDLVAGEDALQGLAETLGEPRRPVAHLAYPVQVEDVAIEPVIDDPRSVEGVGERLGEVAAVEVIGPLMRRGDRAEPPVRGDDEDLPGSDVNRAFARGDPTHPSDLPPRSLRLKPPPPARKPRLGRETARDALRHAVPSCRLATAPIRSTERSRAAETLLRSHPSSRAPIEPR